MSTKQVKQSVVVTLLAMALAILIMDHRASVAIADGDNQPGEASVIALLDAVELGMIVDGDRQQDKPAAPQEKPSQDKAAQDKAAPDKPAEEVYKNIQVLKGLPASRLMGAMNFF